MDSIEKKLPKKVHRTKLQQQAMLALYRMTSPTTAVFLSDRRLLQLIDPDSKSSRNPSYRIQQALRRLEQRGLVERSALNRGKIVLTSKGKQHAKRLHEAQSITIRKPKQWDGRWRVIIFDIWERRRGVRNALRKALTKAKFVRLQNSIWVYPYECEEFIAFLRTDLKLGKSVLYIVAEGIEGDSSLKEHFNLT